MNTVFNSQGVSNVLSVFLFASLVGVFWYIANIC